MLVEITFSTFQTTIENCFQAYEVIVSDPTILERIIL